MRKEIYWDNCVLKTQYQLSIMNGGKEAGGGGSGVITSSQTTIW